MFPLHAREFPFSFTRMDPLLRAGIFSTFIEAILYGLYFVTFLHCLRWLFFKDEGWVLCKSRTQLIPLMTLLIFILLTTDTITAFLILFLYFRGMDLQRLYTLELTAGVIEFLLAVLADSVLIYRCWVVYSRRWQVVCLPLLVWLGGISCSTLALYYYSQNLRWMLSGAEIDRIGRVGGAFYLCTIIVNIYCTSAIVYKVWSVTKNCPTSRGRNLYSTMRIIGESGMLYTLTSISLFVAWILPLRYNQDHLELITIGSAINTPVIGITFNIILIRVANQRRINY
ncbi:hypothetical protein AMATHDRAFT_41765 [Amanita thiersii Skay4041]|uniref:G-protein coupled receptors family 1 profile domain-containing protein n=1 Tax=Amanita thiersii Skay4041 TaxID=703135 RepID=A0A2A9NGD6_9AGAR|nr:hypothetical protein AMATHDRAFT_41765 [Amanita thiersii Skay4041]